MMAERGVPVDHATINRWVVKFSPMLAWEARRHKKPIGKSWRTDETYIKVRRQWKYLCRAVDKQSLTVDFLVRLQMDQTPTNSTRWRRRGGHRAGKAFRVGKFATARVFWT